MGLKEAELPRDVCTTSHIMMEVGGAISRMTKVPGATKNNLSNCMR